MIAPVRAADVARGICRLFARNDVWCLAEMPLRCGRRADLMGIDSRGHVVLVEIKVSMVDLAGDRKWTDYLDYCDRFYWAVPAGFDASPLDGPDFRPEIAGLIVADGYDAEILRPAASSPLAPARRKVEVERLARAAMRRTVTGADPHTLQWGGGG